MKDYVPMAIRALITCTLHYSWRRCLDVTIKSIKVYKCTLILTRYMTTTPVLCVIISPTPPPSFWLMWECGKTNEGHDTTASKAYILWRQPGDKEIVSRGGVSLFVYSVVIVLLSRMS